MSSCFILRDVGADAVVLVTASMHASVLLGEGWWCFFKLLKLLFQRQECGIYAQFIDL